MFIILSFEPVTLIIKGSGESQFLLSFREVQGEMFFALHKPKSLISCLFTEINFFKDWLYQ